VVEADFWREGPSGSPLQALKSDRPGTFYLCYNAPAGLGFVRSSVGFCFASFSTVMASKSVLAHNIGDGPSGRSSSPSAQAHLSSVGDEKVAGGPSLASPYWAWR